jgi:sterol desaturase/sphingolipid hydroxylase (fatty acid hydroxylase superfamily)
MTSIADLGQRLHEVLEALQPGIDIPALWEQFYRPVGSANVLQAQNIAIFIVVGALVFVWGARGSHYTLRDILRSLVPPDLSNPSVKVDVQFFLYDILSLRRLSLTGLRVIFFVPLVMGLVRGLHMWTWPGFSRVAEWAQQLDPVPRSGLAFFLYLLGAEFAFYWYHRAAHQVELLWQFHKVHHYSSEMNPFVAVRVHDLDQTFQILALFIGGESLVGTVFPIYDGDKWNADSFWVAVVYQLLMQVSARFGHSHIRFSWGPVLDRVLNTALIHQMHHSRDIMDKNFGQNLSIWDTVFGTMYRPGPDEVIRFGVEGMRDDQYRSLIDCQVQPYFDAVRVLRRKFSKASAPQTKPAPLT